MSLSKNFLRFSLISFAVLNITQVKAAGFALIENSASGMGNSFAGAAAVAEDASTVFFNPAGLSKLKSDQLSVALHVIMPEAKFTNNGSTINIALGGGALPGPNATTDESALVPNVYYVNQLNDKWTFGLGINAPFGLATDYGTSWVGRYHATRSEVTTININPSASFKLNDKVAIGFGLSAQYIEATLANQIDSAAVCLGAGGGVACTNGTFGMTGVAQAATDSSVSLNGDDWSFGFNFGLLFDISDSSRLGVAYRSNVSHTLKGTADFTRSTALNAFLSFAGSSAFTDTGVTADINLPESLSVSYFQSLSDKWSLLADITWTKWSRFDRLVVDFANPSQPTTTIPENWDDSYRYSVGATYKSSDKLKYRFGLALDETPIPSAVSRTPRIPGNDRTWLSFGIGYQTSDSFSVDVGYAHLFVDNAAISNTDASFGHTLIGSYESSVDILSAQLNWNF